MPGVSRDNDTAGGDLIPSQNTVYANNEEVIIDNDDVAGHGPGEHAGPTLPASINSTVYVTNKLATVQGDPATCGHPATGSSNVFVQDAVAAIAQALGVDTIDRTVLNQELAADIIIGRKIERDNGIDPDTLEGTEYGDGGAGGGGANVAPGGSDNRFDNTSPVTSESGPIPAPSSPSADTAAVAEVPSEQPSNANGEYVKWLPHVDSRVKPQVAQNLIGTSQQVGYQLTITSGYRSPEYNSRVGGAKKSQHTLGNAVDVVQRGLTIQQRQDFIQAAIDNGFTAIGIYNTFTHVDIRGAKVAWGSNGSRSSLPNYPWALEVLRANGYPY